MLQRGPVDVLVMALAEPRFDGSVLTELQKQAASGTIRVLDILVLLKDESGDRFTFKLSDLPADLTANLGFDANETGGLLNWEDAETLFEGMVPLSAVMALAIEHTWAVDLANAIAANGVEVALNFRVPAPVVDEAFASLAPSN